MFGKRKPTSSDQNVNNSPFLVAYRGDDGGMVVKLDSARVGSADAAGIMLVDFMRHFARALTQYGVARCEEEATAEMLSIFKTEVESPTDLGSGSIVN